MTEDAARQLQSDVLSDNKSQNDTVDVDSLDAAVEFHAERMQQGIEKLVVEFNRILDREFGPKP